jgi:hypothetical protein
VISVCIFILRSIANLPLLAKTQIAIISIRKKEQLED